MQAQESQRSGKTRAGAPWTALLVPRLSLATCLGLAFLVLLAVMSVGTLLVKQSTSETARIAGDVASRYEPALRMSRNLAEAVAAYERSVVGVSRASSPDDLAPMQSSGDRMLQSLAQYAQLVPDVGGPDFAALRTRLQELKSQGQTIGDLYRQRGLVISRSVSALDSLASRASRAAGGVASGDQIFTRRSLIELSQSAAAMHASMTAFFAAPSPASAQAGARAGATFNTVLHVRAAELAQSLGQAWLDLEREDLSAALHGQAQFLEIERRLQQARSQFDTSSQGLGELIEIGLQRPAWRALTDEAGRAQATARQTELQLVRVAASIFCALLALAAIIAFGIMGPARRLLEGTRKLEAGALDVRVPRGGVRELDALAAAFNDMAEALHRTQRALRDEQAVLEQRVTERTKQLRHLANHDALTGLPNRRALEAHLATVTSRAATGAGRYALLYMDIDNFKTINDSLGHQFGDRILREIGARLLEFSRDRTFLARLGGDEFTLVVDEISSTEAIDVCVGRIMRSFQRPLRLDDRDILVTLSVGVAMCPEHGQTVDAMLRAADSALFHAKGRGRNRFCVYRAELLAAASRRFNTEQGLRRALETESLLLQYQPEVSLPDMKVSVVEALTRWRQPDGRIATAAAFMPVAEQSGLILEISDWVMRRAIADAKELRRTCWPNARVAINASSQQFLTGRFVESVARALEEADMPADCLEIELTETALQTGRLAVDALRELRRLGVSVALDDFGAGYSSLRSIDELPLTRVKLDGSLMKDVDKNASAGAIAHSIIRLCRSLGLTVTAEGIERPEQLHFLADCGEIHAQGYLIAKPASLEALGSFIGDAAARLAAVWPKPAQRDSAGQSGDGALVPFRRPRAS
jgi:diguanylate cyclase (GGDEF)-like protein